MPNWNTNKVMIEGDDYEISRLLETAIGSAEAKGENEIPFSMNNFYPIPLKDNGEEIDEWGNWRLNNWGVKWDVGSSFCERVPNKVELCYNTPWGPNDTFWDRITEDFPKLKISLAYYEGGSMFGGKREWENGEETNEEYYTGGADVEDMKCFANAVKRIGFEWAHDEILECIAEEAA